jgi:hypothetical protein
MSLLRALLLFDLALPEVRRGRLLRLMRSRPELLGEWHGPMVHSQTRSIILLVNLAIGFQESLRRL